MSYEHYSEEAVKEIMLKVSESHKNGSGNGLSTTASFTSDTLTGFESNNLGKSASITKINSEYEHPTASNNPDFEKTHILLERFFDTTHNQKDIWDNITSQLTQVFDTDTCVEVKKVPSQKKWVHLSHSDLETVVTLTQKNKTAKLTISQRVGFWSSKIEGVLHGAYISLLLFGFIFAMIHPSLAQSIGILLTVWALSGIIVFGFSKTSRKRKRRQINKLANNILDGLPR